jgi:hypothetical protein
MKQGRQPSGCLFLLCYKSEFSYWPDQRQIFYLAWSSGATRDILTVAKDLAFFSFKILVIYIVNYIDYYIINYIVYLPGQIQDLSATLNS